MTYISINEAAHRLGISAAYVRKLVKTEKDFPCRVYSAKITRIVAEKLDSWFLQQKKTKNETTVNTTQV